MPKLASATTPAPAGAHPDPSTSPVVDQAGEPDRRARRRQRVRDEIAAAALDLATDRGWEQVTVDDIAAAVDIAPRTFFRYFPTKDDVLFTDHSDKLARLREALDARPADEPVPTSLRHAVLSLADTFDYEHDLSLRRARLIAETPSLAARNAERQTEWLDTLAAGIAHRLGVAPERDLQTQVAAGATVAAMQAAFRVWLADDGRTPLRELVADALDLVAGGLELPVATAPARRRARPSRPRRPARPSS